MQQIIPHPATRPAHPNMPDLTRYGLFIHLGNVQASGRLELALQALEKTMRCWQGSVRLLVATEENRMWPCVQVPRHCGFHPPDELRRRMQHSNAKILAPAFSDPQGDITLHAIASGVPLGALNLAPLAMEAGAVFPSDGSAFLAIARPAMQSH